MRVRPPILLLFWGLFEDIGQATTLPTILSMQPCRIKEQQCLTDLQWASACECNGEVLVQLPRQLACANTGFGGLSGAALGGVAAAARGHGGHAGGLRVPGAGRDAPDRAHDGTSQAPRPPHSRPSAAGAAGGAVRGSGAKAAARLAAVERGAAVVLHLDVQEELPAGPAYIQVRAAACVPVPIWIQYLWDAAWDSWSPVWSPVILATAGRERASRQAASQHATGDWFATSTAGAVNR